jgi:hypothetical protein
MQDSCLLLHNDSSACSPQQRQRTELAANTLRHHCLLKRACRNQFKASAQAHHNMACLVAGAFALLLLLLPLHEVGKHQSSAADSTVLLKAPKWQSSQTQANQQPTPSQEASAAGSHAAHTCIKAQACEHYPHTEV